MAEVTGSVSSETRTARSGQSIWQPYKKGQGYYTRVGTAIGAGILILGMGHFIWENLTFDEGWVPGMWLKICIPLAVVVLLGFGLYWVVGVSRKTCDFLIATDGEMKKVNWTTRKEIIAATKVVILVTILTAILLFLVDLGFMNFFEWIGVLRGGES